MKNLGKIIILFLISIPLFAEINVSVDKENVTRGEEVVFTLRVTGQGKVRIPPFDQICGYSVESPRQSKRESYTNGEYAQEIALMYSFMPQKSCTIESFPISVNDEEFHTKEINITVSKISISKNEPLIVDLKTDKKSVYVGEPFEMQVSLKGRENINMLGGAISLNDSKNIWVKSESAGKNFVADGYKVQENIYAMSAQQSGKLTLGPLRWDVKVTGQSRDFWGMTRVTAKTRTVFSNEMEIEVKKLPDGVSLVGDMSIEAKVDKKEINAGEAVNLHIEVSGHANIEDVQVFDFHLEGAQAFNEDPKITHYIQGNKYFGTFVQKSAIVAQNDFVIPSFEIKYMDIGTDTVKTIKTEAISIKVLNSTPVKKEELKVSRPSDPVEEQKEVSAESTSLQGVLLVLAGFALGLMFSFLPWKKIFKKKASKKTVSIKESKEVLQLLMSNMSNDIEIEELVKKLSENLYEGKKNEIDKKRLKEILKRVQA